MKQKKELGKKKKEEDWKHVVAITFPLNELFWRKNISSAFSVRLASIWCYRKLSIVNDQGIVYATTPGNKI